MRFSQRYGYTPVKDVVQLEYMDMDLRNSLWNCLETFYWNMARTSHLNDSRNYDLRVICTEIWKDFFKRPLDTIPFSWPEAKSQLRHYFIDQAEWYQVYDFIEFISKNDSSKSLPSRPLLFRLEVNHILEREMAGYRFVDELIVAITDRTEIDEIETAMNVDNRSVTEHLQDALHLLSDRENRDYRNSVKESISAVEGMVKSTLGTDQGTLGNLLKSLDGRARLHPAFKDALGKLYGYTSDEGGIRHALQEDSREVTFDEAKFMLVVCSAFINYIRGSAKA